MKLVDLNFPDLLHICRNMREADRREINATRWDERPEAIAHSIMPFSDVAWIGGASGEAIAAIGAVPVWPNVWSMWMFATDNLPHIGFGLTKFVKRSMIPMLFEQGAHRLECRTIEGHDQAHKWLESFGAKREGDAGHVGYGKGGETFFTYALTRA